VTEQVRLDRELQEKFREVEEANSRKDEFLAVLGHELRNPLAALQNAVIVAQVDPQRRDPVLRIARRQVDQLKRLIDDLLDVTRVTHGRIDLQKEPVCFSTVVERALEGARPMIDARRQKLSVRVASDDLRIEADAARIEQVILNLLSNAAKYTDPEGRIEVSAEQEGEQAVLRISDSGIGIAPEMLSRIFEMFTQVDEGMDRAWEGWESG
jgi:signal transduction histidine kinase